MTTTTQTTPAAASSNGATFAGTTDTTRTDAVLGALETSRNADAGDRRTLYAEHAQALALLAVADGLHAIADQLAAREF